MSTYALSIGIDFGTTNSAMAWFSPDTKQAEIILNAEGEAKTPSLVYFGEDEVLVGKPVEDLLEDSENYEEEERADITRRTVKSIKRTLIYPPIIAIPGREPARPVEVVAEILKKLKRDAEEGHFQEEVERAVITCPAVFDSLQRKVVFDGATLAGFGIVDLVEEPVAAAMAFAHLGQKVGRGVLVYDLGGGTFDLAVVAREVNGSDDGLFRVAMEPDGDPVCGGDDFDRAIYDHCDGIARDRLGRSVNSSDGSVNLYLLNKCRRQKERLTYKNQAVVRDYLDGVLFKAELDRQVFEAMIGSQVENTARKTAAIAERARDRGHEVDTVVLIGGSSQVPLVARRLEEALTVEPRRFANRDYAVALGAAYYASVLEVPARERYRRTLEIGWADGRLSEEEVEHIRGLAKELGLSANESARIHREVLGAAIEEVLERQREEYRGLVAEAWTDRRLDKTKSDRLDALAKELALDSDVAAGIEREVLGDTREAVLLHQYRAAVQVARDRLRALADELGLSAEQAADIEGELVGDVAGGTSEQRAGREEPEAGEDFTEARKLLDEATGYWGQGRMDLALQSAQAACELAPNYAPAFFTKSRLFRDRGEWRLAVAAATQCLRIEPEHPGALHDRGVYMTNLGDHAGAWRDADRLVALAPNRDSYAWRAVTNSKMRDHTSAVSDIRAALQDARDAALSGSLHAVAGVFLHQKLDSPKEALVHFGEALEAMPASYGGEYAERFAHACGSFDVRVQYPPATAVHKWLWEACKAVHGGRVREAAETFDLSVEPTPHARIGPQVWAGDPEFGLYYASKYARANDGSRVAGWLRDIIALHPGFDIRLARKDRWIRECQDPTLQEFLTPTFSYSHSMGTLFNSLKLKNESAFRVTSITVTVEVVRAGGGRDAPIELKLDALGIGQSHGWKDVFPDAGLFGGKIHAVNANVSCAEQL